MRHLAKLIVLALALCAGTANAQTYPSKPVRVVIPFAPGGSSDTILRPLAEKLGAALGQPFVVETKAGGQTVIGGEIVAKAPPDGYTLYMMAGTHVLLPHLLKTVPFDVHRDFAPVALIATQPYVLMAHPSQPFSTVREMLAHARANPGKLSFGASDIVTRVAVDSLLKQANVDAPVVSYKGGGPLMNDLLGGHIGAGFGSALLLSYVRDGRLKPLAVSSPARLSIAPDLPTVAEAAGLPGYDMQTWYAIAGPANLPPAVIDRLHAAIRAAIMEPDMRKRYAEVGWELPADTSASRARTVMKSYADQMGKLMEAAGIQPE